MVAPQENAHEGPDDNCGCKEQSPCRNADQAEKQDSEHNDQPNGMACPYPCAEPAERDNLGRMAVLIGASNHLAGRMAAECSIRFHGVASFAPKRDPALSGPPAAGRLSRVICVPPTARLKPCPDEERLLPPCLSWPFRAARGGPSTPRACGQFPRRGRGASASRRRRR